jgi:hypothetical protein
MKFSTVFRTVLPLLLLMSSVASAAPVVFERALPTGPNVNADAPGNATTDAERSNIKWAPTGQDILGDDFKLLHDAVIDTITVWMVGDSAETTNPNQELSSIHLYTGIDAHMTLAATTYTFAPVTYANGQGYWNPVQGIFQPIFELTFTNLNWAVSANTLYDFAVEGVGLNGHLLSLHASNAALSASRQDGFDEFFLGFTGTPLTGPYRLDYAWGSDPMWDDLWDKDSDINVRITGTPVPEPSSFGLLGLGIGVLVYFRRLQ